ncbi:trans-Golgi network integral membrane protein 2-like [Condylostylus longicornis]|uniref:trans-Golgi network integral membrane protein 2-like n=1 Tax=Condylostylus longicornis TaxID=2530218 RepID=UPI00244E20C8|nr:trans-Golgi network integral membrane protein 2-like [Condylostylus longicornis]
MFVVIYILTIILSDVLAASISNNEQSIWNDFKSKNIKYQFFIQFGKESKCFREDDANFDIFFQALSGALNSANTKTLSGPEKETDLINYQETLRSRANETIFCAELHDNMPQDSKFAKLLLHDETCLAFCFCKSGLLKEKLPDKGCSLLHYIYTKIKTEKNIQDKKNVGKTSEVNEEPKATESEVKKADDIKTDIIEETSKSSKLPDPEVTQKKTELAQADSKSETSSKKPVTKDITPEVVSKAIENTKGINTVSNNISPNEDDANAFYAAKTEKPIEQDKNAKANNEDLIPSLPFQPDNEESYENEEENIQNTDNNIPKVEQSQSYHNINDNEFQKPIISTKYYTVQEDAGSNFFTYLFMAMFLTIVFYVIYHNKTKILALMLEGRRGKSGRGRRKHTASYSKLDSNLEEAISSPYSGRSSQIIY